MLKKLTWSSVITVYGSSVALSTLCLCAPISASNPLSIVCTCTVHSVARKQRSCPRNTTCLFEKTGSPLSVRGRPVPEMLNDPGLAPQCDILALRTHLHSRRTMFTKSKKTPSKTRCWLCQFLGISHCLDKEVGWVVPPHTYPANAYAPALVCSTSAPPPPPHVQGPTHHHRIAVG